MTIHPSNKKSASKKMVAPPRFEPTEDDLARLIFGSDSAAAELGSKFEEENRARYH